MDVMANNLANASTVGFKKEGTTSQSFNDVLAVKIKDESVGLSNVQRIGINNPGVKSARTIQIILRVPIVLRGTPMIWRCQEMVSLKLNLKAKKEKEKEKLLTCILVPDSLP